MSFLIPPETPKVALSLIHPPPVMKSLQGFGVGVGLGVQFGLGVHVGVGVGVTVGVTVGVGVGVGVGGRIISGIVNVF